MSTGSRGVGIRLSLGARAEVVPRDDGEVIVTLDGEVSDAPVTRAVASIMAPGTGFDISIDNDLPVSQGFGMSAAGAIAAGLAIADVAGMSRSEAFAAAHVAEVRCGGGLGDVSAIVGGRDVPIRTVAGLPPHGAVRNAGFKIPRITLAVGGTRRAEVPRVPCGHVHAGQQHLHRCAGGGPLGDAGQGPREDLQMLFEPSRGDRSKSVKRTSSPPTSKRPILAPQSSQAWA